MIAKCYTTKELQDALVAIENGKLCLLKGDIGYGLLGNSEVAIRKMYIAKGRSLSNPCIVISNMLVLCNIASFPNREIKNWIARMSAETTMAVVLPINPDSELLSTLPPWVYGKVVTDSTVAAFLNVGPFLENLVERARKQGMLIVGSSANLSSQGNVYDFNELPQQIIAAADFSIDHGISRYSNPKRKATTIVNFANWSIKRYGVNCEQIVPSFQQLKSKLMLN